MNTLALLGGTPAIAAPLRPFNAMGDEECDAVERVMRSGVLSGFYGSPGDAFWGGPVVREFEEKWAGRFGSRHAVSMNSATSCLVAAMGAIGLGPGDEVIVPPMTMSATVMAPLIYGAVPVFADMEDRTFCLDPEAVRRAITPRTKAILAVNLFGHPAPLAELSALARERGLYLVEDNAQGPLAEEAGRLAGTWGDIGVFSLNYHKHIHTGEGGLCVSDDDALARRLRLIRNHGENVVADLGISDLVDLVGFNFRLTELQAAIGLEQLKKIDAAVGRVEEIARELTQGLAGLEGLTLPPVRPGCRHVYYIWALRYDEAVTGVRRETICQALAAEGVPVEQGYVQPLYMLPLLQRKVAIGRNGFPFTEAPGVRYDKGLCPVSERLYEKELIQFQPCSWDLDPDGPRRIVGAFRKVFAGLDRLRQWEGR